MRPLDLTVVVTFLAVTAIQGCRCGRDTKDAASTSDPLAQNAVYPGAVASQDSTEYDVVLLTPEQMAKNIELTLGYKEGVTDGDGVFHDGIADGLGPILGGINFTTAYRRDPNPKVQTLLVIRALAAALSSGIVGKAIDDSSPSRAIFAIADLRNDRPYVASEDAGLPASEAEAVKAGQERWLQQLIALHGRIIGRPPTQDELRDYRDFFVSAWQHQNKFVPAAWVAVAYVMISTQEFWTR